MDLSVPRSSFPNWTEDILEEGRMFRQGSTLAAG